MPAVDKQPSARTVATRARIISTAEQLFAEKGVASVSLNEITRAAGQKNRNAVHYHFGDKNSLLQAIFEKHWAPISAQRSAMIDAVGQKNLVFLSDDYAPVDRLLSQVLLNENLSENQSF